MPPSTTSGPKPYEYHLLQAPSHLLLTLAFSPEAFIQKGDSCEGNYQIRLTLWAQQSLCFSGERRLTFYATSTGLPYTPNLYTWHIPITPSSTPLTWLLECWDTQQNQVWIDADTLKAGSFKPLFLGCEGTLCSFSEILSQTQVILTSPTPIVEVILYQAESKLPGVQRYLSLQERRFIRVKTAYADTLRLNWRKDELKAGEYLIGIYAYRGNLVIAEAFYRVFKRA